jgi:anti-anti-sigma factor
MELVSKKWDVFDVLEIQGRIDGLTAPVVKQSVDQAAIDGRRNLILDFSQVSYMSSAGLRVILQSHKELNKIGGKLTLVAIPSAIMDVFNVSGMAGFLQIYDEYKSLPSIQKPTWESFESTEINLDGISFELRKVSAHYGKFFAFGSEEKLLNSSYGPSDPVVLKPAGIAFGLGLAALGEDYSDYKSFFGETVVIGHHCFSYPSVNRSVVDYSYFSQDAQHSLNFLYGFGINGEFARILRFDESQKPISIEVLIEAVKKIAETPAFGVVILGMSGGIYGMHLKKSPILENQPENGNILDTGHFPNWMNFSLESEEINKTIIAFGIVVRSNGIRDTGLAKVLPENGGMHLHAAVFENGLWSNNILEFEHELLRVAREFEPQKVIHLLPDSKLKSGYIAIINLEVN